MAAASLPHDHNPDWVHELQRVAATSRALPGAAVRAVLATIDAFQAEDGLLPHPASNAQTALAARLEEPSTSAGACHSRRGAVCGPQAASSPGTGTGARTRRLNRPTAAGLADAVDARKAFHEQTDEQRHRQPDDVQVVAFDPFDERRAPALDGVGARPPFPLAGRDIRGDVPPRQRPERDERRRRFDYLPVRAQEAEPGDDRVRLPCEPPRACCSASAASVGFA